ncbi:MAG: pyruvate kinase alpha/beta domain-containing protein [Acidobacteriota bacterium]
MGDHQTTCYVFENPGKENTKKTIEIAVQKAEERNVKNILIPSCSGHTGLMAAPYFKNRNLGVVTHSTGFLKPDHQQLKKENKVKLEKFGVKILTCQHALGGVGRAVRKKLGTYQLEEIIAYTLRMFGEGTKVAVEISLMAADAGLVSTKQECISMGGTSEGLDTALLLKPAHAQNFFDLKIMEILAKPRLI